MSVGTFYNIVKGNANPTFWTVERTAKALGVSAWEMLGCNELIMRAWLAGQNVDLVLLTKRVEARRRTREGFSTEELTGNTASELDENSKCAPLSSIDLRGGRP
ncbi:MAG: hypothetical protein KGL46_09820 [Hyphomicrobiales bacterium]|nr:hypothetical protein [Hyphomicrobiales bacterium]